MVLVDLYIVNWFVYLCGGGDVVGFVECCCDLFGGCFECGVVGIVGWCDVG